MTNAPAAPRSADIWFLLIITIAAALLRFALLSRPTLWNDEVLTYSRVCGTHAEMLELLKDDGFGPLHYEMDWLLGHLVTLTPFMLRLIPAVAGTLTIPATYLLGRELFDRRVGRLAAVLACTSAFLLAYSRDAKMYMELWLAVTAHVALLYAALRTGNWWVWGGWLIAGTTAVWLHAAGFWLLPLDLLIVLQHPRGTVGRTLILLAGWVAIIAGPAWYVLTVSRVPRDFRNHGWGATGIGWVNGRTDGHTATALLADTATSFAFGFSWIEERFGRADAPKWIMLAATALLIAIAGVGCVAIFLPRKIEPNGPARSRSGLSLWFWIAIPIYVTYRVTFPDTSSVVSILTEPSPVVWLVAVGVIAGCWWVGRRPPWRRAAVATTVAAVIAAAGSAFSGILADIDSPVRSLLWNVSDAFTLVAIAAAAIGIVYLRLAGGTTRDRLGRGLRTAGVVAASLAMCVVVDLACRNSRSGSIWIPRYLGTIYPALLVGTAALLWRLPWPAVRWTTVGVLLFVNLAQAAAHVFVRSEPPVDLRAADVVAAANSAGATATAQGIADFRSGPHGMGSIYNTCGKYYLVMDTGTHLSPSVFRTVQTNVLYPLDLFFGPPVVAYAAAAHPRAERLIVWGPAVDRRGNQINVAPLRGWHVEHADLYPVRSFWDWGTLYVDRRVVYVKDR